MASENPTPDEIVACVLEAWREKLLEQATLERLVALGLSPEEGTKAMDLVGSGMFRVGIIRGGIPAANISSDFNDHPVFLAAVRAAKAAEPKSSPEPVEVHPVALWLPADDVDTRRAAVYQLGQTDPPGAVEQLLEALNDADLYVRLYAIQALSGLKTQRAVGPCCQLLRESKERILLTNAIRALVNIRDPAAVPALIEVTRHENPFVRHDAAWALGEFSDPIAIPALNALLQDTTVPVERDELGLTSQTSLYRVCDQAQRSLEHFHSKSPLSSAEKKDVILLLACGAAALAVMLYILLSGSFEGVVFRVGLLVLALFLYLFFKRRKRIERPSKDK